MTLDEQAKKTLSVGLIIAGLIFAGFAYWHFVILKIHYKRNEGLKKTLNDEIKTYRAQMKEIQEMEAQKDRIEEMRKIVAEAARRLPDTADAVGFYQELIRILRITGVQTERVAPGANRVQTLYTEIPYGVVCQCRYHELGQFLNLIEENQNRFMRVNSFDVGNNNNRPSIHPVKIGISTFMFNK